jgi:hypothetical protein
MRKGRLVAVLASGVFLLGAGQAAAAQVLPVGIWSFNDGSGTTAKDSSVFPAMHDNGTLRTGTTFGAGRFSGALSFDGNDAAVNIPNEPGLEGSQVTVSAWVNFNGSPGVDKYILAKGSNQCSAASYGLYTGLHNGIQFYVGSNSGLSFTMSPDGGNIWDGKWHSVIGTFDGSTARLYVDGKEAGSGTPVSNPISYGLPTTNDLLVGNYDGCGGLGFPGQIDEVKVFNRALGSEEIRLAVLASKLLPTGSTYFPDDLVL